MLNQYKNINEIKSTTKSISADRIDRAKLDVVSYSTEQPIFFNTDIVNSAADSRLELHVYVDDAWITGNHKIQLQRKIPQYIDKITNKSISIINPIAINIFAEFEKLKLTSGNFRFVVNFFKNLIGSYERQHLRIDEISPDRTEIRLRAIDDEDIEFLQQITNYIQTVNQTSSKFYKTYLLNFSRNQCVLFVNSVVIGEYLYVKLYEPLPQNITVDFKCWVVEEQKPAYIDTVDISSIGSLKTFKSLANPNWQANAIANTSTETSLKTWTDLLSSTTQTSQQLVDTYFSGSLMGMQLNIDYSDFNNFIFYSSARERLQNFKYKLELLEYYTSQSLFVSTLSGSVATTNALDFGVLKTNLVSGFDNFEKYLYYESSSKLTTFDIPKESFNVTELTGSYIQPVPKTNSTKPYALTSTTSSIFKSWYNNLFETASLYDLSNINALIYTIPEFLTLDISNTNFTTFVHMLGQHYDILYTYVHHASLLHKREENPKLGMPNELLYSVAKQFGWTLTNGKQNQELWEYILGTNEAGIPLTGSNSVGDPAVSGQNTTYAIWRRIVNNLPLLLKSKGTKRSVQALLACYGIPQSIISINEYGGPRLNRAPVYEKYNFNYALDLSSSAAGTVTTNYSQSINTVELRFRPDDVATNPSIPTIMNLFNVGSNSVTLEFNSGNKGVMKINGTSSGLIELYSDEWLNTMLKTNGTNLDLITKKSKYGKIVAAVSASATASFGVTGSIILGGTSTGASRFVGQLQEFRIWSSSLNESAFDNHVKAAGAYNANSDAYDELVFRLPLNQKINHATTSSLTGIQPKTSTISSSFASWSINTPYDSYEETQYYDAPSLGAGTFDDNKIRIEQNELIGGLDVKTRAERSQFDKAPLDSKKLGIYFSPQSMIDEDIIAQLGFIDLDQYIGDPGETDSKSYPRLIQTAQTYWKKYSDKNDINAYINMFTLFDLSFFRQLDQLLPARAHKLTGILVQPNVLERSKDKILPTVARFDSSYNSRIENSQVTASGEYPQYLSETDAKILTLTAQDDDQWQIYLTASTSKKYDGVAYSHQYLIKAGSTYITASSPYWLSDALMPTYTSSVLSELRYVSSSVSAITSSGPIGIYGLGTYGAYSYGINVERRFTGSFAEFQDYLPRGIENQRYSGAKMTSPDFNINSTQTIDGGPVVEFKTANPNQLIYQSQDNTQGSFRLV
jgi:hypothetical protein